MVASSDRPVFTAVQLDEYLERINLASHDRSDRSYSGLATLVRQQLIHVPFETLALHYSRDKSISLDPSALFDKIVGRRRGGYCLENNTLFGCVLRSLGFRVYGVICRISKGTWGVHDGSWRPMSHMANVVIIDGFKYLVDVGYGADGPVVPLPLRSGTICEGLIGQELKLDLHGLPQHQDPAQNVWVYSQHRGAGAWQDVYHFPDVEVLPLDFDVLNFYNMTNSLWARTVVAQRFLPATDGRMATTVLLVRNEIRRADGVDPDPTVTVTLRTEGQRLEALQEHFGVVLSPEERDAIRGATVELT